jgi:dihydrodipicolinate synthase/N-acetylneuraminate lyase
LQFQIDADISCGSIGENRALSLDERAKIIELATANAIGRIAVIAATGCSPQKWQQRRA